jgi:hypothetical protein
MAYTKQTWHDSPATDTPLSAARLGHIEDGVFNAAAAADTANADIASLTPASIGAADVNNVYDKSTSDSRYLQLATGGDVQGAINALGGIFGEFAKTTVSDNYTVTNTDQIIIVTGTVADITITVPLAATIGQKFFAIAIDAALAHKVTIAKSGANTLVGTIDAFAGAQFSIFSNGTDTIYVWGNAVPTSSQLETAFFLNENLGSAKTISWSRDKRKQSGVINLTPCTVTIDILPDGEYLELEFATAVANAVLNFAQTVSGVVNIVYMNHGSSPSVPAASGASVGFLIRRLGATMLINQTGASA